MVTVSLPYTNAEHDDRRKVTDLAREKTID